MSNFANTGAVWGNRKLPPAPVIASPTKKRPVSKQSSAQYSTSKSMTSKSSAQETPPPPVRPQAHIKSETLSKLDIFKCKEEGSEVTSAPIFQKKKVDGPTLEDKLKLAENP